MIEVGTPCFVPPGQLCEIRVGKEIRVFEVRTCDLTRKSSWWSCLGYFIPPADVGERVIRARFKADKFPEREPTEAERKWLKGLGVIW